MVVPASLLHAVCVLALCLGAVSAKVTFPESPRDAATTKAATAAAPAPGTGVSQSRLLADPDGSFGLSPGLGVPGSEGGFAAILGLGGRGGPDCPLCHPTVYSYCGDRLLHDACCCLRDTQPLPPQCQLADCSFLHAKSCSEHSLITRCCCDRRRGVL